MDRPTRSPESRFRRIASAGIFFQGGAAAADSSTVVAALVHGLTGSAFAVGAASAILRGGWMIPQLFVGYLAQRSERRMPFYVIGAFGRATCLAALAVVLAVAGGLSDNVVIALFFTLWTAYAFVSGIVAVPYNDIVARSVVSGRRSRLLAIRFFGGGLLALGVAAVAHDLLGSMPFPAGYAAVVSIGAALLYASSISFVTAGEPAAPPRPDDAAGLADFVRQGVSVFRSDARFRTFVHAQWLGGAVMMALPFYVLQAKAQAIGMADVAVLLGAQTAGALLSNPLWGWWGDHRGKRSLLEGVAILRALPPLLTLAWVATGASAEAPPLVVFGVIFLLLGAFTNGMTIAMLGYLMEISPDDRRPAYSGYFNALVAPASLLPLAGAAIVEMASLSALFGASLAAAILQYLTLRRLRALPAEAAP